jgi:hypothetical protein
VGLLVNENKYYTSVHLHESVKLDQDSLYQIFVLKWEPQVRPDEIGVGLESNICTCIPIHNHMWLDKITIGAFFDN